ncbi:Phthiocerol synthesis polyketide synthase type I PpsE [Phycisphaerae bacterium RAS2]|nr:Phthiocerol synthesis polyketide synthase type I PpsE [Phycisphaerae bacterium RAS2]
MTPRRDGIAIVGMACRYPDARTPSELWENVLAQRRSFRRIPAERMRMEDYFSSDRAAEDRTYSCEAALIEGYEFDRVKFRVSGSQFRSADLAHWMALDIATQALADAGFEGGTDLPKESTGVLLANTLTGDTSRANVLRLRWPYVRRVVGAAMAEQGRTSEEIETFLRTLEPSYKQPFPTVNEETLAGGLSNTIAGRICNHFDLKGGGYTLDGACAASLLAVSNACSAIVAGDLDVAIAGGVDLSLDPFELIGFAKAGALASDDMRVYDARSSGFWPGEGCGFVVLMREEAAIAQGRRIHAVIRGWGVSSDGSGGITRPEPAGQRLALKRAYQRAGFGIDTIGYFEGHGTGTRVGDETELGVLTAARREAGAFGPAAIGSIKANIGHTKAAAGLAGLLKATMAAREAVIPPISGCGEPHALLREKDAALRVARVPEAWDRAEPMRTAVSAMGFGGLNTHVVLESPSREPAARPARRPRRHSFAQDGELFVFTAESAMELREQAARVAAVAPNLSRAELTDLAANLAARTESAKESSAVDAKSPWRGAVVASAPSELAERAARLVEWIDSGETNRIDATGVFLGNGHGSPRIGFVFPGQGCAARRDGGAWRERFETVRDLYETADLPAHGNDVQTDVAQPAIVAAELAALRALERLGIAAQVAAGHSLGELTALHWAGAMDEPALFRVATARGRAMADLPEPHGAMAAIMASADEVEAMAAGTGAVVSAINAPDLTVVSGECAAMAQVMARADARGIGATRLKVSHAFHSPLVSRAAGPLAEQLRRESLRPLSRRVVSTITGRELPADANLEELLVTQVTAPVRFTDAVRRMAHDVDLLIEAGPGRVLGGLIGRFAPTPVVSMDAASDSVRGLLCTAGAVHAIGAPVRVSALFEDRLTRPFDLNRRLRFIASPCESAPILDCAGGVTTPARAPGTGEDVASEATDVAMNSGESALSVVRELVAQKAELPVESVTECSRLLGDLHLNSIVVGQIAVAACKRLGLPAPVSPTAYAGATVGGLAQALDELRATGRETSEDAGSADDAPPAGVDSWVRPFVVTWRERPLRPADAHELDATNEALRERESAALAAAAGDGWRVIAHQLCPFKGRISAALARGGRGAGVLVCVPPQYAESSPAMLLEGARAVLQDNSPARLVIVQDGREGELPGGMGAEAFARTLHLEAPHVAVSVVHVPTAHEKAVEWVMTETRHAEGFREVRYDAQGRRYEPVLTPLTAPIAQSIDVELKEPIARAIGSSEPQPILSPDSTACADGSLNSGDVLLVTGGGKGIAAECAMELALETGVKLALLGRSDPARDTELSANLARFEQSGVAFKYLRADVTDAESVSAAVREAERALGPVTAFLHGAGANTPKLIAELDKQAFNETLLPKVQGARNVLAAVDADRLKLFVAFGSLIARAGMAGEADYAVANDWLGSLVERWGAQHPHCRSLAIEWSVWSGVGMGERLGRIDALARQGIRAITPDEGVRVMKRLFARDTPSRVLVTSRFGDAPTMALEGPSLPFRRFLESPRVYYPGVELIVDANLSPASDPHLDDHVFHGERLFAAVLGLEAMAQTAMAVAGSDAPPNFENVQLAQPIVVPDSGVTIRIAALVRDDGTVDVAVRSAQTGFAVDHFRATCRFGSALIQDRAVSDRMMFAALPPRLNLAPDTDLYGKLLFHTGRFRVVRGYHVLAAKECLAELGEPATDDLVNGSARRWFGSYLPADLMLGCPAARDGTIHAIQACIPHAAILPTGVERIDVYAVRVDTARYVEARERSQCGAEFVYDVRVFAPDGALIEAWHGLKLRAVAPAAQHGALAPVLLAPSLERRAAELLGASVRVALVEERGASQPSANGNGHDGNGTDSATMDRRAQSDAALSELLDSDSRWSRRSDGKLAAQDGRGVTTSHGAGLTLAVAADDATALGCDIEPVTARSPDAWRDLLGAARFALAQQIAGVAGESLDMAATRVWTIIECAAKAGLSHDLPLTLMDFHRDGWLTIRAGRASAMTAAFAASNERPALAVGLLAMNETVGARHAGV